MTIRLRILDREGNEHEEEVAGTGSLMEALREFDYGVAAICGGMCSCATCHVYIGSQWAGKLPPQHVDEKDLLAELQHRAADSRLACQVQLTQELDGLQLSLAPEE